MEKWDLGNDGIYKNSKLLDTEQSERLYNRMILDMEEILSSLWAKSTSSERWRMYCDLDDIIPFIKKIASVDYSKAFHEKDIFDRIYESIILTKRS